MTRTTTDTRVYAYVEYEIDNGCAAAYDGYLFDVYTDTESAMADLAARGVASGSENGAHRIEIQDACDREVIAEWTYRGGWTFPPLDGEED